MGSFTGSEDITVALPQTPKAGTQLGFNSFFANEAAGFDRRRERLADGDISLRVLRHPVGVKTKQSSSGRHARTSMGW